MSADGVVMIVGTGRVSPSLAAAFSIAADDVVIVGRDQSRAGAAAASARRLGSANIRSESFRMTVLRDAALVIEAVREDIPTKQHILRTIEDWTSDTCIIATNTSSLSLETLAASLDHPDRFGALHFLHPAHLTTVVEVAACRRTSSGTLAALLAWVESLDKRPILLRRAVPGFIWNRLQAAILRECCDLLEKGVCDPADIDAVVADGLAPRWMATGPLQTVDLGGPSLFVELMDNLLPTLSTNPSASSILRRAETSVFFEWKREDIEMATRLRELILGTASQLSSSRPTLQPYRGD